MVLQKTLESPLDCKEMQPVHPKGDQSWVFIGRTDAEAETPILWPYAKSSLRLTSIESVMLSSHLILCHPLLRLTPIPPSIRVFSSESTLHMRWSKYWSFSFSISPTNEHSGLISFRMGLSSEDHGIWSHHFMGNRWGNSGNSVRLYFSGLQNHCRWLLQP